MFLTLATHLLDASQVGRMAKWQKQLEQLEADSPVDL